MGKALDDRLEAHGHGPVFCVERAEDEASAASPAVEAAVLPAAEAKPVKVGRNDPCPCGSGKKYKKCCGQ